MMIEVKVPSPGESISQVLLSKWLVADGDMVEKDAEIAEIDSDKATLSIYAAEDGKIKLMASEGDTVDVGAVVCVIDASIITEKDNEKQLIPIAETPKVEISKAEKKTEKKEDVNVHISPLARKVMEENNISEQEIVEKYKSIRISRKEVVNISTKNIEPQKVSFSRETEHKKMTPLRIKLAERLVAVKNQTAMLTTFNEVNMSALLAIKKQYSETFKEKYGVGFGFMSFFTKAVTEALSLYPSVNSMIDGDEFIIPAYADISIAVSAPKGLVVPVIRNAESLTIAEIELKIKELATKARDNKITLEEMSGGTFTITNGGVFGSMMSTPIINPPQSAILGMHNIIERPVAINGEVKIQPMMYIALSYDHRIIDGRESVGFLVKVKEMIENPVKMLFKGQEPIKQLLGL
jgi:2-oxoglutarate dehydrogenase E2 component (dihydrolipoamide succinyltransferase)